MPLAVKASTTTQHVSTACAPLAWVLITQGIAILTPELIFLQTLKDNQGKANQLASKAGMRS